MDIPLLDSLDDAPDLLLDEASQSSDPFLQASDPYVSEGSPSADNYLFLSPDPFLTDPALDPEPHPKTELVLHPFDVTAMSLSGSASGPLPPSHPVALPPAPDAGQENRSRAGNVAASVGRDRGKSPGVRKTVAGKKVLGGVGGKKGGKLEENEVRRVKDKLAQRKLRNKESARRYREKQVARRRQLENYTRTLTEQNRELESLHDRLLTLTCERRMRGIDVPLAQVADAIPPGVL